ncbi:MAG: 23S rRNA (guanosine2251-2'-O)-methyltransferase [Chloroflexi bacterium]|nr:MAG: 23S rRNA (guanosine2251-2'-O)-methyltransferase [Chloroflexota bacterium]MBA4376434.1 23S rRNA (guanosine(2251)-2'-O)-methyltransferase RlmB [Anaerolinea sp.]
MKEWIIGRNPVMEVLKTKRREVFRLLLATGVEDKGRINEIVKLATARKIPVERVPKEKLAHMGENPQGIALEVSRYPYVDLADILDLAARKQEDLFILLLDLIQNPQNLGTLLRSAEAAGVHGVIIPPHRAAEVTPAVVNASAGATEHMFIAQGNLVQICGELKEAGAWIVGLEGGSDSKPVHEVPLDGPIAIIVGNEGEGMRALVRESCDFLLSLPMLGKIESLNAAVAGSIVLYQVVVTRQKSQIKQS